MDEHPTAAEYDWRTRFGEPLRSIFDGTMSYREAWWLVQELLRDPTSHLAAAAADMKYPWSREAATLADLYDLMRMANTDPKARRQVKPYPRPIQGESADEKRSRKPSATQEQILAALRKRGHQ